MFERFTGQSRRVIVRSQEEAWELGHDRIGTEHLLLGLLQEREGLLARVLGALRGRAETGHRPLGRRESVAARALGDLGLDRGTVLAGVVEAVGRGAGSVPRHVPFTLRTEKALEQSLHEAIGLGHGHIGTEHLLLGLLHGSHNTAVSVLRGLGVSQEEARRQVHHTLDVLATGTRE
ncbi:MULTISPECIES: Clp protease N-terminal domain-containing protein [Nocardiopsis]|uniref:Clp R domain-containing protein n=1 Tax=Nocardiopsis sinuspersici TaxID=501010 RepID=A0A1V3C2R4_9ACTN|nr:MULTISPECIES: Clp protease N-terminal domain-containing protein [Nocardiopsis]OOC55091.1 hypothetical protein NOSIN_15815 [Nocardiopsis sinuspersici]